MGNDATNPGFREFDEESTSKKSSKATKGGGTITTAMSLGDLMLAGSLDVPSHLTKTAIDYLDTIKESSDLTGFPIEIHRLKGPNFEVAILGKGDFGIALIFEESYTPTGGKPVASASREVDELVKMYHPKMKIDQTIVVRPNMYTRADKMASFFKNEYVSRNAPNMTGITIDIFKNGNYAISRDINEVRKYMAARSPHATPVRDDIGVILYEVRSKNTNNNHTDFYNAHNREESRIPIMAITGYTTFYAAPTVSMNGGVASLGHNQFMPMTVITDIVSDLKGPSMIAIAFANAVDSIIQRQGWLDQFSNYSDKVPNIGNLIKDDNNKPWRALDQTRRDEFLRMYMAKPQPMLAIDIQEGHARFGLLDDMVKNPGQLNDLLVAFTNSGPFPAPQVQVMQAYDGEVDILNETVDSRKVDYLFLANLLGDTSKLQSFLFQPENPAVLLDSIKEHYPNKTTSLYKTLRIVLNPQFVTSVAQALVGRLKVKYDDATNQGVVDMSALAQGYTYNAFGGLAAPGSPVGGNLTNSPFDF